MSGIGLVTWGVVVPAVVVTGDTVPGGYLGGGKVGVNGGYVREGLQGRSGLLSHRGVLY